MGCVAVRKRKFCEVRCGEHAKQALLQRCAAVCGTEGKDWHVRSAVSASIDPVPQSKDVYMRRQLTLAHPSSDPVPQSKEVSMRRQLSLAHPSSDPDLPATNLRQLQVCAAPPSAWTNAA